MYLKIEKGLLEEIEKVTHSDYSSEDGILDNDTCTVMLLELLSTIMNLQEEVKDIEKDREENYTRKRVDYYDYYGVSINDFI